MVSRVKDHRDSDGGEDKLWYDKIYCLEDNGWAGKIPCSRIIVSSRLRVEA